MNSDCNCWGYWALSANYWAQMIAFKYFSQRTGNKKQLAQLCQGISLPPPVGLRGKEAKSLRTGDKFSTNSLCFPILLPTTSVSAEPAGLASPGLLSSISLMAMSGKGLRKELCSLCSLKGQKQQNSFSEEGERNLISLLFGFPVLFPSLDSYGQNNLEVSPTPFTISSWQLTYSSCLLLWMGTSVAPL